MVGIFAVYAFEEIWKVAKMIYYGLLALNHRGQSGCGMVLYGGKLDMMVSDEGHVDRAFNIAELVDKAGWAGVGWTLSSIGKTIYRVTVDGKGGILVTYAPLQEGELKKIESVLPVLKKDVDEGTTRLNELSRELRKPLTFCLITQDGELYAYRDPSGLKPLHVGSYGFDLAVISSESCAIECIGADPRCDLHPGSCIRVDKYVVERSSVKDDRNRKFCILEYVYYARLDSIVDNIPIYDFRKTLSQEIAKRCLDLDVDVVIGIPETGVTYAIEIAKVLGKDFTIGFVQTGRRTRSALVQDYLERLIGVQLKMSPIRSVMKGRAVLFVDDSLLKGITLKNVVQYVKNRVGVKKAYVLVATPPIKFECPFGVDIPPRSELLCANIPMEDIAKVLDADCVRFATLEDVYNAFARFGVNSENVCTYCITGQLPAW